VRALFGRRTRPPWLNSLSTGALNVGMAKECRTAVDSLRFQNTNESEELSISVKVKVWTLAEQRSRCATYMSQTRHQQRFTISEVAADWHEPMYRSALCGHPLPALMDNWTHGAASRHSIAPISHTRPSPRSRSYYSFPVPLRVGGWVGLSTQ